MIPSKQEDETINSNSTPKNLNLPFESRLRKETIRRILKTKSKCNCWCCLDSGIRYDYELLQEEIKSTQKSIANCKADTNKILSKVQRLEAYFQ